MKHSNVKDESCAFVDILLPAVKGMLGGVGTMLALAVLLCGVSLALGDPDKAATIFAYAALAVSTLFCGVFGMISDKDRRIIVPVISGALYVLVLIILSLFVHLGEGAVPMLWRALAYIACVSLSTLGGLAVGRRQRRSGGSTKNPAALMRKRISGKK